MNFISDRIGYNSEVTLDYPLASDVRIIFDSGEELPLWTMYSKSEIYHIFETAVMFKPSSVTSIIPEEDDMYVYNIILNII